MEETAPVGKTTSGNSSSGMGPGGSLEAIPEEGEEAADAEAETSDAGVNLVYLQELVDELHETLEEQAQQELDSILERLVYNDPKYDQMELMMNQHAVYTTFGADVNQYGEGTVECEGREVRGVTLEVSLEYSECFADMSNGQGP